MKTVHTVWSHVFSSSHVCLGIISTDLCCFPHTEALSLFYSILSFNRNFNSSSLMSLRMRCRYDIDTVTRIYFTFNLMVTCLYRLIDVYITSNEGEMQHWVNNHVYKPSSSIDRANHLAVGLDIEWKPSFSRGGNRKTAIIQISTLSSVLIAQVINHRQLPQPLIDLISDGQCKKVGVGILQDLEKIKSDFLASYRVSIWIVLDGSLMMCIAAGIL